MEVRLGTAPDSWGVWFASDPKQTPWQRYLDEVVAAGYQWTELGPFGYMPTDAATLQPELEGRGLGVLATMEMMDLANPEAWPKIEQHALGAGELLASLGAKFYGPICQTYSDLFQGKQVAPKAYDDTSWKRMIETNHKLGEIIKMKFGLTLTFHPHAETPVEYEDQIEKFLEDTDPNLVSLCLDTGHHAYRGGDPSAFLRKYYKRIPYLHFKSVDPIMRKKVETGGIPFAIAVGQDMFVEPSKGAVNFPEFLGVLREINYDGWAAVEQDMYPAPFEKPLPIAKRTRTYLREIGIG